MGIRSPYISVQNLSAEYQSHIVYTARHDKSPKIKMFKLVVLFAVVAVAAAKPGFLAAVPAIETRTSVIGESTIENHGNAVVHATAPVTTSISSPAVLETRSVVPAVAPVVHSAPFITSYAAPATPLFYSSPFYGAHYF